MKISATIIVILISTYVVSASLLDPVIENVVHLQASKPPKEVRGMWKKKTIWKLRWMKEWKSAKVMKPVWKKIWSPVQIREWVPMPKPPPGWDSISTPLAPIHSKPTKTLMHDSVGYGSFPVQATSNIPLWDPVPYPESQQPPPPPAYPDNIHSATFDEEQLSGIIGARYNTNEYSPQYSETMNRLTRVPIASSWRPPQKLPNFQNFPALPEFLIPPQYQTLLENNPRFQEQQSRPGDLAQKNLGKWIPLPPKNKIKVPDTPYKFQLPETLVGNRTHQLSPAASLKEKQSFKTHNVSDSYRHHADGSFIQEAQLVGEFHYSEFDLIKKLEQVKGEKNKQSQQNERFAHKQEADEKTRQTRTEIKREKTLPKPIFNEIYPASETPNLLFIPPNHRSSTDKNNSENAFNEASTKPHAVITVAPAQSVPEHILYKNSSLQIVYPTAPQTAPDALYKTYSYNATTEDIRGTTEKHSTPFSIVFSSSLEEEVTKSPVLIVTPAKTESS